MLPFLLTSIIIFKSISFFRCTFFNGAMMTTARVFMILKKREIAGKVHSSQPQQPFRFMTLDYTCAFCFLVKAMMTRARVFEEK